MGIHGEGTLSVPPHSPGRKNVKVKFRFRMRKLRNLISGLLVNAASVCVDVGPRGLLVLKLLSRKKDESEICSRMLDN